MKHGSVTLFPALADYVQGLSAVAVAEDRKPVLDQLTGYIQAKLDSGSAVNLQFICTHNSRRSQLSQVWAKVAAVSYGIRIKSFSGGTEATAFNERAVASLRRSGFEITAEGVGNPRYTVRFAEDCQALTCFSKRFDDPENTVPVFAAVMTCADADEHCPFVPGAETRIPLRYEDPKRYDDTPEEALRYDERSRQIAAEMMYVFSRVQKKG